jgi:hypothetical protein
VHLAWKKLVIQRLHFGKVAHEQDNDVRVPWHGKPSPPVKKGMMKGGNPFLWFTPARS